MLEHRSLEPSAGEEAVVHQVVGCGQQAGGVDALPALSQARVSRKPAVRDNNIVDSCYKVIRLDFILNFLLCTSMGHTLSRTCSGVPVPRSGSALFARISPVGYDRSIPGVFT